MPLRDIANACLQTIIHDTIVGGVGCTLTSPSGTVEDLLMIDSNIHQSIDPDTGQIVTGTQITAAISIHDLNAVGFEGVKGISLRTSRPWVLRTTDVMGNELVLKVTESLPDHTIGLMLLRLESYRIT